MSARNLDPNSIMLRWANSLHPDDGCVECGYAFAYRLEGCDACRPITELLDLLGRADEVDR